MFYLVMMICATSGQACGPVVLPGAPFATMQECRDAGNAISSADLKDSVLGIAATGGASVGQFICLKR